jgi:hypothetical protein
MNRSIFMGACLLLGFLVACKDKGTAPPSGDATMSARVADAAPTMARPQAAPLDAAAERAAASGDAAAAETAAAPAKPTGKKVGVEACDSYLEKMARCIGKLSPESAEPMRAAMDDSRRAWQETAQTAEGRAALSDACKSALEAAQAAAKAMGCSW